MAATPSRRNADAPSGRRRVLLGLLLLVTAGLYWLPGPETAPRKPGPGVPAAPRATSGGLGPPPSPPGHSPAAPASGPASGDEGTTKPSDADAAYVIAIDCVDVDQLPIACPPVVEISCFLPRGPEWVSHPLEDGLTTVDHCWMGELRAEGFSIRPFVRPHEDNTALVLEASVDTGPTQLCAVGPNGEEVVGGLVLSDGEAPLAELGPDGCVEMRVTVGGDGFRIRAPEYGEWFAPWGDGFVRGPWKKGHPGDFLLEEDTFYAILAPVRPVRVACRDTEIVCPAPADIHIATGRCWKNHRSAAPPCDFAPDQTDPSQGDWTCLMADHEWACACLPTVRCAKLPAGANELHIAASVPPEPDD